MRVISGTYRSRRLLTPRGLDTRPTSDRLRETLFNVLAPRIAGSIFVDLYAGSGANGIEALSRGAKFAYFVERATPALAAIRANLNALGIKADFAIEARSVAGVLRTWAETRKEVDIIFLDPPYEQVDEYTATLGLLGGPCGLLLGKKSLVIAEHRRKTALNSRYGTLLRYRLLEQGDAALSFFAPSEFPDENPV